VTRLHLKNVAFTEPRTKFIILHVAGKFNKQRSVVLQALRVLVVFLH